MAALCRRVFNYMSACFCRSFFSSVFPFLRCVIRLFLIWVFFCLSLISFFQSFPSFFFYPFLCFVFFFIPFLGFVFKLFMKSISFFLHFFFFLFRLFLRSFYLSCALSLICYYFCEVWVVSNDKDDNDNGSK